MPNFSSSPAGAGLIIFQPTDSIRKWVEFWSKRYNYTGEDMQLYASNIKGPHTVQTLTGLFRWKIGRRFAQTHLPLVQKHFISRIEEARNLADKVPPDEFLNKFSDGGPIYRIFWLHVWNNAFPIYDMHVHRAMAYIDTGRIEEPPNGGKAIFNYLDRYLPFYRRFAGIDHRQVDRALWAFGKFIKQWEKMGDGDEEVAVR
jgi:hypothetical protein